MKSPMQSAARWLATGVGFARQWRQAGVREDGQVRATVAGTPQGGVITPRTHKVTSVDAIIRTDWRRRIAPARRCRGNGNAVADHNRVIADEHPLDERFDQIFAVLSPFGGGDLHAPRQLKLTKATSMITST